MTTRTDRPFVTTRGAAPPASLRQALLAGLAPDGGLYLPASVEPFGPQELDELRGLGWPELAAAVLRRLLGPEPPEHELVALCRAALGFPVPLVEVAPGIGVLELFHGPTLAFKDVAARVLAGLVGWSLKEGGAGGEPGVGGGGGREQEQERGQQQGRSREATGALTVLVATSGDTGSAVAHAFHGMAGVRVVVLYPEGRVSPIQERQLATLGGNVTALAVDGSFDDCQRLVKAAFADPSLAGRVRLTSANSISLGRLLPQAAYYFHAWRQLPADTAPPLFAVPSGNLGNLTAGLLARRLGLPAAGFVAATNANDTLPRYLATGRAEPRASVATLSNAMDVGDPSNLERVRALFGDDVEALREEVAASAWDDAATRDTIRRVWRRHGRVLDPHTAVGWLGLEDALERRADGPPGVVLATAHPAKFPEVVEPLVGPDAVEVPERLARCLGREVRARRVAAEMGVLRGVLLEG